MLTEINSLGGASFDETDKALIDERLEHRGIMWLKVFVDGVELQDADLSLQIKLMDHVQDSNAGDVTRPEHERDTP
jgi:hypothetical protein